MIDEIQVENLALIREATLVPARGLTVLTGETGAGKTALLSALKLLMGARADKDAVRDGEEALSVSGRFYGAVFSGFASSDDLAGRSSADAVESGEADDGVPVELVAMRRVTSDGRSRVSIDGRMASVGELARAIAPTIDLCGQHEHQQLMKTSQHVRMLDAWAGDAVVQARTAYEEAFATANAAAAELTRVREAGEASSAKLDEARFVLCGCAVLGAALVANLLDNNAYEPMYGLWQSEYAGLLLVGVFAWMLVERVRRLRLAAEQVRDLEVQVRAAEAGLRHLRSGEEATRAARHDLRHHAAALSRLIDAGEQERCRAYLVELSGQQEAEAPLRYADNLVANAVMAAYLAPAQAAGIEVRCEARVPAELPLRDTELSVLLSNLLSNAVEACERVRAEGAGRPFVSLSMRAQDGRLAVRCENAAVPGASFSRTSKADASRHGLGLPAMRQIVERHGGALYADVEGGVAVVRIVIRLDG